MPPLQKHFSKPDIKMLHNKRETRTSRILQSIRQVWVPALMRLNRRIGNPSYGGVRGRGYRPLPTRFLWLLIADQILRRAVHDLTQLSKGGGRDGLVMSDSLERARFNALVSKIIIGNVVFLHIFPHRCKRNRHDITSCQLYVTWLISL